MSGRGERGRGGRGRGRGRGGRGRGSSYLEANTSSKKGLCAALGDNVFDMVIKQPQIKCIHPGRRWSNTTYGQDISNELLNKQELVLAEPTHMAAILACHATYETMVRDNQARMRMARADKRALLEDAIAQNIDTDVPMKLATLDNEIAVAEFEHNTEVPLELTDDEKTQHANKWRAYRNRKAQLEKHHGQVFSLIHSQCTQLLQDRKKQDTDWDAISTSFEPLGLYWLVEKTILAQTEDQYPFAMVYDQENGLYSFWQETMLNPQYYE